MGFNPIGVALMSPFHYLLPKRNVGRIYIIGAPRSGTTITYQKILKSFNVKYLDNYLHMLFGVPFLRGLSNSFKPSEAEHSHHGFVPGLRGAAEGLHFWKYWLGLDTTIRDMNTAKIKHLKKYIDYLEWNRRPFLSCYLGMLGHAQQLAMVDPDVFLILLQRDPLEVKKSMAKCYIDNDMAEDKWFSLHEDVPPPHGREKKVQQQIELYQRLIASDRSAPPANVVMLTYNEVKEFSPATQQRILEKYNQFADSRKLSKLQMRNHG